MTNVANLSADDAAAIEVAAGALAEKGHAALSCPNCSAPVIGPYCAACGQERDTHRRSVWHLVSDLVEDVISFDSRILRTGVALMTEPGEIAVAFREGRPHRYVPALRLYFFVSLVFFVILSASHLAIVQFQVMATPEKVVHTDKGYFLVNPKADKTDPDEPELIPISKTKALKPGVKYAFSARTYFFAPVGLYHSQLSPDALAKLMGNRETGKPAETESWFETRMMGTMKALVADPAALNEPLTVWLPRVLFLLLPLFALLLWLFYVRQRKQFYFVDHLIFSLNMHSFVFIALIVAIGVAQFTGSDWVGLAGLGAMGVYLLIAMKRFYHQSWFWTVLKFVCIGFIYTTFFLAPALAGVIVASIFWS
ncbi:MAG TPA: DUF3667 domain-containing protein [Rhizomicrobium sp.]|jgi:hypothetical protein